MRIDRHLWFWLAALVVLVVLLALLREILLPFVAGIAIAYFLNPIADRLQGIGLSRTLATVLIIGCGGLIVVLLALLVMPMLVEQSRQLAVAMPGEVERFRSMFDQWAQARLGSWFPDFKASLEKAIGELTQNWMGALAGAAGKLLDRGLAFVNFLSLLLVTPIVVFYLLVDWHPMLARIDAWLPREHAPTIRRLAGEINGAVAAFVRGQGTICLILAVFYGLALSMLGLRYGLLIGVVTGLMIFVPIVGWLVGLLTAIGFAAIQWGGALSPLLQVAGVFVAGQAIDSALLSPKIVGEKIGLHPVWMIFALFACSYLFGFVGTLVAVPLAAALAVLVRHALATYLASEVYRGGPPESPARRQERS